MRKKAEKIDIQNVSAQRIPSHRFFKSAALAVLNNKLNSFSLCIRVVDEIESASLNERYRKKKGPTNVLAFPVNEFLPDGSILLGDIVICALVVKREAKSQRKTINAHFAHMVVHGSLHLLGFDHQTVKEEKKMQALEIQCLHQIGFTNPYSS